VELRERLSWLTELAERLDIAVRYEHLGGDGGGLCTVKSRRMLFVDLDADPQTRYQAVLLALVGLPELHDHCLPPVISEDLERIRSRRSV